MTSKERMLIAMQNGVPDRVPAAPDFSTMIPERLTGKPTWDIELYGNPPLWKAYIDAVKYFGTDGWFIYGGVGLKTDSKVEFRARIISQDDERIRREVIYVTPIGEMVSETVYFKSNSATTTVKPIKNLKDDFEKLKYLYPEILGYDTAYLEETRKELGDLGALGCTCTYPGFQNWFTVCNTGLEELSYTYMDYPELIEEWRVMEHERSIKIMEMTIDAKPDFILLGGSGSITMQSPSLFRELSLPTIKQMTRMAKEAGIPTMIHSCGKERALVEMCANETDLNCVNPLEIPPMGDCDLAEIKQTFGHKVAMMGNLHTTEVMLKGSPEDVEREALKCIEDAASGGGFILSTGDQCGRDTPDANIRKLVEVCEKYGRY
ncbi:MAG: uroporphyrinogen decarboxylase family protein [Armatimonadota bacterium]